MLDRALTQSDAAHERQRLRQLRDRVPYKQAHMRLVLPTLDLDL